MSNNVIDFNAAKNIKKLNVKEIGNINITVYAEETTNCPIYYILPNREELIPIVDLLDNTLTNNGFEFLETLKVQKL